MSVKAVILIGGPLKGTRFRPLSLDVPKPLFPIAGLPIVQHHIEACMKIPNLKEILLIGFYPYSEMQQFVSKIMQEYKISIRYLQEYAPLGTGGGMYHFRDQIRAGNPDAFFFLHGDVCADFPLQEMLAMHQLKSNVLTILGTEATRQQSLNYGCVVEDKETHQVLHYVDKPSTFVSTLVSCGVYVFSPEVFGLIAKVFHQREEEILSGEREVGQDREAIYLEKDIISRLVAEKRVGVYHTNNWWSQIKSPAAAIYANRHYLALFAKQNRERLAPPSASIIGDVYVHPTATVDPTAILGPNVSIGNHAVIGPGCRIHDSIILGQSKVGGHSLVVYSIIGWGSDIGDWSRVEGTPCDPNPNKPFAKMDNSPLFNQEGKLSPCITILGSSVAVSAELVVRNSIVLPHKEISRSVNNEIVL